MFGKAAGPELTVDQLAIQLNIKDASTPLDQFTFDTMFLLDRTRQTDGPGSKVSLQAIFDRYVHVCYSCLNPIIYASDPLLPQCNEKSAASIYKNPRYPYKLLRSCAV